MVFKENDESTTQLLLLSYVHSMAVSTYILAVGVFV